MQARVRLAPDRMEIWDVPGNPRGISRAVARAIEHDDEFARQTGRLVVMRRPLLFNFADITEEWLDPWTAVGDDFTDDPEDAEYDEDAEPLLIDCEDAHRLLARFVRQAAQLARRPAPRRYSMASRTSPTTFHTWHRIHTPELGYVDLDLGAVLQQAGTPHVGGWADFAVKQLRAAARDGWLGPEGKLVEKVITYAQAAAKKT